MSNTLAANTESVDPLDNNKLKTWKRRSIKVLLTMFVIVTVLLGLFVVINWSDEALSERAKLLLREPPRQVADAQNAYYILKAMDAPADTDVFKTAVDKEHAERAEFLKNRGIYTASVKDPEKPATVTFTWDQKQCQQMPNCVQDILAHRTNLSGLMKDNQLLLQRYQMMQKMGNYEELLLPTYMASVPAYSQLMRAMDMQTTKAVFEMADGKFETGLQELESNNHYTRLMLGKSSSLISKMVLLTALCKQVRVVSELAVLYPVLMVQYAERLNLLVKPMSDVERSLVAAISYEVMVNMRFVQDLPENAKAAQNSSDPEMSSWQYKMLAGKYSFHVNATSNLFARHWDIILNTASQKLPDTVTMKKQLIELQEKNLGTGILSAHHYVYNPAGKMLASTVIPDQFSSFLERSIDADAYLRLVALQFDILSKKIPVTDIPAYVDNAAAVFRSPYDGAAMKWDVRTRQLSFTGHEKASTNPDGGKISIVSLI
ncbi:hypothetical protein ACO0LC_16325 [Undibacterium sp. JH2W]|uniref:hypothetical protein n=1 Tax=Undibacterium sp. JH2W TaxID=3413037 RepID=UPI003BEFBC2E